MQKARRALAVVVSVETLMAAASGQSVAFPVAQIAHICASATIREASERSGPLAWMRVPDSDLEEWRSRFVEHNKLDVQVVAWRESEQEGADALSFWIAPGPEGHKACYYTTAHSEGLLEALTAQFGAPASLDRYEHATIAHWKDGGVETSFSEVGSHAGVNISRQN